MFPRVKNRHLFITPFLIILLIIAIQTGILEYKKSLSFEDVAGATTAVTEVDFSKMEKTKVIEVVDGDTIKIEEGRTVRYIGVDTPETKHPKKPVECFGREASDANKALVENKYVYIEKDISDIDRYQRILRYVYLPNPENTGEAIFVNEYLVEQGYAHLLTYPPDVKYNEIFKAAEKIARDENRGLWGKCN
ncbi:hypothetical protein A3A93_00285 [Candidatus Roizmanbacteria bacterium RIFCSPLOWO2_01_FULL_38_12]|uniref:TNase-like domain-containing protein n=1 Tax=Candidatus Roizmanbacteria bacterium RIFCSPLOWO2_01_FULL_38_12 TaxID=1802061 RepID=A0A1F7IUF4_9BACT|nr:MAG: hypothetical protein A3F59_01105 [Candidatus Roizmanbacteria bacterium RIFCSPHIGHO2_12_FULL_38_13]OGK46979.1 MAG: hypothetical protein A3A93_00285 [Candidatus Roizmanbacteria bacterium RIFCSPLOWO2_01_FULL_38_12]